MKEQSAGAGRLLLLWQIYNLFGDVPVRIIASCVAFFTYFFAKEQRHAIKKYFSILLKYTKNNCYKPSFTNSLKVFLNYADSLVDKMIAFSGNFKQENISFENEEEQQVRQEIASGKGIFFITTHIGNAELIRTLLFFEKYRVHSKVNVFLKAEQCKIFNDFINRIAKKTDLETFAVEDININTSIIIKDKLDKGELVFMAGDRESADNTNKIYQSDLLGEKINLPVGTLKFAQLMENPIYFVVCAKNGKKYKIHTQKFKTEKMTKKEVLKDLEHGYAKFLEKYTLKYPYQFYNFFDIFRN